MNYFKNFIFIMTLFFCGLVYSKNEEILSNQIEIMFIVDQVTEAEFSGHFIINNKSSLELKNWNVGFTFQRIIDSISNATIIKQIGDYYLIRGKENNKTIIANSSVSFNVHGKYTIRNNDDMPAGFFLIYEDKNNIKQRLIDLPRKYIFSVRKKTNASSEYEFNIKKNMTAIEENPIQPNVTPAQTIIIPLPVTIEMNKGYFHLQPNTVIYTLINDDSAKKVAYYLSAILSPATGYKLSIKETTDFTSINNAIFLLVKSTHTLLGKEGYQLIIDEKNILIQANTEAGLFYAVQSLRQLLPSQIFNSQLQQSVLWKIPNVKINDYPRFGYRGVLLDVSRHFFPVEQIKKLLDLMAMLKLNIFHWHLTDDESWRIEIKKYPELTNIGAFRGYEEKIPPALGSGYKRYGGYYTQAQIHDIVSYASARHITIIPEIDLPAHARALIFSLPGKLIDKEDQSIYSSVRGFHDNVLSPCIPGTYEVLENIIDELVELFPGPYIHIGSDERPDGAWEKSPACIALMKKLKFKDTHQLQNYFSRKIQNYLTTKNKKLAAWEEIIQGGSLTKESPPLIYAWLGMGNEKKAADQGYDVILTPYQYLYLELAYAEDADEIGDYWGGYVDTFKVYSYAPLSQLTPKQILQIKGIEGGIWTEYINSIQRLEYLTFPKLAALAEVAWSPANKRNWINFSNRIGQYYLPALDNYQVIYRLSPPGFSNISGFLKANVEFPGLILRYTIDKTTPTKDSEIYSNPIKMNSENIIFRSFDTKGRGSKNSGR